MNGDKNWGSNMAEAQYNKGYKIVISQRYKSQGVYTYSVEVNKDIIKVFENTQAEQFFDLKVYVANSFQSVCNGTISNVRMTNFL